MSFDLPFPTFPAFCDKQVLKFQKSFKCAGLPARNMAKSCKKKTGRQVHLEILLNYVLRRTMNTEKKE